MRLASGRVRGDATRFPKAHLNGASTRTAMNADAPEDVEDRALRALQEGERMKCTRPVPIIGGSDELAPAVEAAWAKAQAYWSKFLLLGAPVNGTASGSVAMIDLATRQVSLDLNLIRKHG